MRRLNDRGFTLAELMVAMTILAVGLLALAQLQIVALQGTSVSRQFSSATNLARETAESIKLSGVFMTKEGSATELNTEFLSPILSNATTTNDDWGDPDEPNFAPEINKDTVISDLSYDYIEVVEDAGATFVQICGEVNNTPKAYPDTCDVDNLEPGQYVRIINVKSNHAVDNNATVKDVNVIVLWKERNFTRSVSIRTMVGRKHFAFF